MGIELDDVDAGTTWVSGPLSGDGTNDPLWTAHAGYPLDKDDAGDLSLVCSTYMCPPDDEGDAEVRCVEHGFITYVTCTPRTYDPIAKARDVAATHNNEVDRYMRAVARDKARAALAQRNIGSTVVSP
jgi:hypothetical protein